MHDFLPLLDVARTRALEANARREFGVDEAALMRRAADAAWQVLKRRWPLARRVGVAAGTGNNGGDGAWLAAQAAAEGVEVHWVALQSTPMRDAIAEAGRLEAIRAGVHAQVFEQVLPDVDVWVDAIFGIGLAREPTGIAAALIRAVNASGRPVLSLDVPSGVSADSGAAPGDAVQASATLTFFARKCGLVTGVGRGLAGEVEVATLDLPPAWIAAQAGDMGWFQGQPGRWMLPVRPHVAHKACFGRLLVVGGAPGMAGAPRLAAEAALRCGAGLVSVATDPSHVGGWLAALPEAMCHGTASASELRPLLDDAGLVVCGPGLGRAAWAQTLLDAVLASGRPMVLDADALNLLAEAPIKVPGAILTPHPGEAARLLGRRTGEIAADPFDAAVAIARRYAAVTVLKGAGTLVADPSGRVVAVAGGNPGMAVPGMGDVLAGVVGALHVQGLSAFDSACRGVALHAAAGDALASQGQHGILARDLIGQLRPCLNR